MLELMISMGILMIFAGGSILAFTYSTRSAITTRNQGLARAIMNEQLNMMQVRPWTSLTVDDVWTGTADPTKTVTLWQYTKGGNITKVDATVDIWTIAEPDVSDARVVRIQVKYTFQGKQVTLDSSTIRAKDA